MAQGAPSPDLFTKPRPLGSRNPALDVVDRYLDRSPDAEYVSLQGYGLADVAGVVEPLASLPNMRSVSLAHNLLTSLPEDLGGWRLVDTLDLTHNRFATAAAVLRGLLSLPSLRTLRLHLPAEEEHHLIAALPALRTFNGVALDDADDADDEPVHSGPSQEQGPAEAPRGYRLPPASTAVFEPWTTATTHHYRGVYTACADAAGRAACPEEYDELSDAVVGHLRARVQGEPDVLRQQQHQFHAGGLLLEYAFEDLVRSSGRHGREMSTALRQVLDANVRLMRQASTLITALQDDRDRKLGALQEDLARQLLVAEHTAATGVADPVAVRKAAVPLDEEARARLLQGATLPEAELEPLVEELFASKRKHDAANHSAGLPPETLEQHVYTYYCARYTTKEAVRSATSALLKSASLLTDVASPTVAVFCHCLRLELPERSWDHHVALKASLSDAVAAAASAQPAHLQATLAVADCESVLRGSLEPAELEAALSAVRTRLPSAQSRVSAQLVVSLALRAAVSVATSRVAPVAAAWHAVDRERCGVLDMARFHSVVAAVAPAAGPSQTAGVLRAADPHRTGMVIFSAAVDALGHRH